MNIFLLVLAVALGGGIGAVVRHFLAYFFHGLIGLPEYIAIMLVNITGCFLIGLVFFWIEARYKKNIASPLRKADLAKPLTNKGWWPKPDPTQPVVSDFNDNLKARLYAAFIITGILGGMTTFSLYSLLSLMLLQQWDYIAVAINAGGTVVIGFIATYLGLKLGQKLII